MQWVNVIKRKDTVHKMVSAQEKKEKRKVFDRGKGDENDRNGFVSSFRVSMCPLLKLFAGRKIEGEMPIERIR